MLLVPVFFCVTGMMINLQAMADPQVLIFAFIYSGVAMLAKIFGCGLPALLVNFNLRGAARVGVGMVPRGEVGLIIASLGLNAGILSDRLFAAVIIMVVINTVVAPPALVRLFKNKASGVKKAPEAGADDRQIVFNFGSFPVVDLFVAKLNEILEAEGFYVHLLSQADRLYQLRKESMVIEFQQDGTDIRFFCHDDEVHFVNTAVMDAVASLEHTLKALRRAQQETDFSNAMSEAGKNGNGNGKTGKNRKISRFINPGRMITDMKGTTEEEVIDELLQFLCSTGQLSGDHLDSVRAAVFSREAGMSTGLVDGLAIPHARVNCVDHLICVVGVSQAGIEFKSLDGKPSHFFVLTVSPQDKPTSHLEFIALITGVYRSCGIDRLLKAHDAQEVYRLLLQQDEPQ
jgi:mannitol/fructose-specific phosphotransferase system IIA component (Ntr-type)